MVQKIAIYAQNCAFYRLLKVYGIWYALKKRPL